MKAEFKKCEEINKSQNINSIIHYQSREKAILHVFCFLKAALKLCRALNNKAELASNNHTEELSQCGKKQGYDKLTNQNLRFFKIFDPRIP